MTNVTQSHKSGQLKKNLRMVYDYIYVFSCFVGVFFPKLKFLNIAI